MQTRKEITRRHFLKLGFAGISTSALFFVPGCAGHTDDDEGNDDEDQAGRRRGLIGGGLMRLLRHGTRHRR